MSHVSIHPPSQPPTQTKQQLAAQGEWHNASARARQAAHIFTYLGTHVQMLTSMVLRDYLELKVSPSVVFTLFSTSHQSLCRRHHRSRLEKYRPSGASVR